MLKKIQLGILAILGISHGCVVSKPLPFLGECADTQGLDVYEYGQVGIGTCLSGPTNLAIWQDPDGVVEPHLLVVNSNFEYNFRDGSLLAIPLSAIDTDRDTNYLHELGATAMSLPTFPAGLDVTADGAYALVSARTSDKLMGERTDRVYVAALDGLADGQLLSADRGSEQDDEGRSYVPVSTDPFSVVAHPDTGLVYVLSLHDHEVVVLDESVSPIVILDIVGSGDVSAPLFEDLDDSGSLADFQLDAFSPTIAVNEDWEIRFREGTYSFFLGLEGDEGTDLWRLDSSDARSFVEPAIADLEAPGPGDWCEGGFGRASVLVDISGDVGYRRMWVEGTDADGLSSIGATETTGTWASDWGLNSLETPVLEPADSGFDSQGVSDPAIIVDGDAQLLFYTATGDDGRTIGLAAGDASALARGADPVLEPESGWDGHEVYGPAAYRWELTQEDLLYYTGSDGVSSSIGLAIGIEGADFLRVESDVSNPGRVLAPGDEGAWDSAAVAYPAVIHDAGLFHMFYAGTDGETWRLGHATSFDGVRWQRDPSNPIQTPLDAGDTALVFGATKTSSGDYYAVEGSVSGPMADAYGEGDTVAVPSEMFVNVSCPIVFTIVDRHVLGSGDDGTAWEDGSGAPALLWETDGGLTLYYVTVEDGLEMLGRASSEDGRSFTREGSVEFTSSVAGGDLEGVGGPSAADFGTERMLAFHGWRGTSWAIYAAAGSTDADFEPLAGGEPVLEPSAEGWDSSAVASPSLVEIDGELWMFYQGSNGSRSSIGAARYDGGSETFTRVAGGIEPGLVFEPGGPGDWDDSWVGQPHVRVTDDGTLAMVYAASDNNDVRLGYATSSDGLTWERHVDSDGVPSAILGPDDPGFDSDGLFEPFVLDIEGQLALWYEGRLGVEPGVPRLGLALERSDAVWVKAYSRMHRDDGFVLTTEAGDGEPESSIDLGDSTGLLIDGTLVFGSGVSGMTLTPDGRFLVVTNKLYDNIYVIDVWDDSDGTELDANYHGIEAVIQVPNHYEVTGTRGVAFTDDGATMVVLLAPLVQIENSDRRYGPEALLVLDFSRIEDDSEAQIYDDLLVGYAATARGVEEDEGNPTIISGGPTNVVFDADEELAYVAHYNDNSVHVYRMGLGRDPVLIDVIEGMGEEPFDLVLTPDGKHLIVANYVGELQGETQNVAHSTLTVVDVDPQSETYHQVVTTLRNLDAW